MPRPMPDPAPGSFVITTHSAGPIWSAIAMGVASVVLIVSLIISNWEVAFGAAAGLGLGWIALRKPLDALLRWRRPELILPAATLGLGDDVVLIYRRQSRKVTDVSTSQITFELVCQERATYQQGTDTRTASSDVFKHKVTADAQSTPWGFQATITMQIPMDAGAPTMKLAHNEIQWKIETEALGGTVPSDNHIFDVVVAPRVGSSQAPSAGVQDS